MRAALYISLILAVMAITLYEAYSGIELLTLLGIDGNRVLLGAIPFSE